MHIHISRITCLADKRKCHSLNMISFDVHSSHPGLPGNPSAVCTPHPGHNLYKTYQACIVCNMHIVYIVGTVYSVDNE